MSDQNDTAPYVGWTRLPGQTWQRAVTGATAEDAARRLDEHLTTMRYSSVSLYVAHKDIDPNDVAAPADA